MTEMTMTFFNILNNEIIINNIFMTKKTLTQQWKRPSHSSCVKKSKRQKQQLWWIQKVNQPKVIKFEKKNQNWRKTEKETIQNLNYDTRHPTVNILQQWIELRRKKIVTLKPTGDSTLTACFFQAVAGMFLSTSVSIRMQPTLVEGLLSGFVCRCFLSLLQMGQSTSAINNSSINSSNNNNNSKATT